MTFRRPVYERTPVVLRPIAPENRRGVMAPVEPQDAIPRQRTYRSKAHRARVATLACVDCGAKDGTVVPAHMNLGKGMAIKASDAAIAALCLRCHSRLDQGGAMTKEQRRAYEWEMVAKTYIALQEAKK